MELPEPETGLGCIGTFGMTHGPQNSALRPVGPKTANPAHVRFATR